MLIPTPQHGHSTTQRLDLLDMKSKVIVQGEEIDVDDVEFVDIEEDWSGRDVMTFVWQGQEFKSYIIVRPNKDHII